MIINLDNKKKFVNYVSRIMYLEYIWNHISRIILQTYITMQKKDCQQNFV